MEINFHVLFLGGFSMLKIKHFVSANKLIAAIFAIIVLVSVTFAANSFFTEDKPAACTFSYKTEYFKDATYSVSVGYTGKLCGGGNVSSGKKTAYSLTLYCNCEEDIK